MNGLVKLKERHGDLTDGAKPALLCKQAGLCSLRWPRTVFSWVSAVAALQPGLVDMEVKVFPYVRRHA